MAAVRVESPNVTYTDEYIESRYVYHTTDVTPIVCKQTDASTDKISIKPAPHGTPASLYVAVPRQSVYTFRTERRVPRLGVMLVGWGGNNGCTVTAMTIANRLRLSWHTKEGLQKANYYGSITQSSTVLLGNDAHDGSPVHVPLGAMLPMVEPNDIVFDG